MASSGALRAWLLLLSLGLAWEPAASWERVSVEDFGAVGDNASDNTHAFRAALLAVKAAGGGEVLVPGPAATIVFLTAPFNLSSNVELRVEGTVRAVQNSSAFPLVAVLPSYGSCCADDEAHLNGQATRVHPFVWAVGAANVTISGGGTIDGAGQYWWPHQSAPRPHLLELNSVTGAVVTGVTLLNSAFWTFHPVYCRDVWIHHMQIQVPWLAHVGGKNLSGFNGDGIDVDSCQDVMIEHNWINCGDDHVTILSGMGQAGRDWGMPSKNVTVSDNKLGTGMGLSIGSSVSGGIEDVLYTRNVMNETAGQWGLGIHIKTKTGNGGYIKNVVYSDNYFEVAGTPGGAIEIECGYQSGAPTGCNVSSCTEIRDIVFRNLTFAHAGGTGGIKCFPERPCQNITLDDVHIENLAGGVGWDCEGVGSGSFTAVTPARDLASKSDCNFTTLLP